MCVPLQGFNICKLNVYVVFELIYKCVCDGVYGFRVYGLHIETEINKNELNAMIRGHQGERESVLRHRHRLRFKGPIFTAVPTSVFCMDKTVKWFNEECELRRV